MDHAMRRPCISILVESDFVENEIFYYMQRFEEKGIDVRLTSRLWGAAFLEFRGHEWGAPLKATYDVEELPNDPPDALLVPGGFVADRLRYSDDISRVPPTTQVVADFLNSKIPVAFACHGLMLLSHTPRVLSQRKVTAHPNLIGDVRNMGAVYVDEDVVWDDNLLTVRTASHANLLSSELLKMLNVDDSVATPAYRAITKTPPDLPHYLTAARGI